MSGTVYRKAGRTFRAELLRGAFSTLEISEWGEAREDGSRFQARSSKHQLNAESPEPGPLLQLAGRLQPLEVDRFVLLSGNVVHQIEDRSWTEQFARAFVSLRHEEIRVSFELGGRAPEDLDLKPVLEANSLLRRLQPAGRQQTSITLAPYVAASLWPALAGSVAGIGQSTHPEFRLDGDGREIQEAAPGAPWPNRFRPSYRARAVPAPFHLRASWKRSDARPEFSAIGMITPFAVDPSGIRARLLFREGFAATVSFPVAALRSTDTPHLWFPYFAGSYGQETLVESAVLTP